MSFFRKCRPCAIFVVIYIGAIVAYSFYSYHVNKNNTLRNLDEKLFLVASGVKQCLPRDFHDRALKDGDITPEEDRLNVAALSEYARKMRVKNVYTLVKVGGNVYFTSSSCTEQEIGVAVETPYFLRYDDAGESIHSAFAKTIPTYASNSDRWGSFRSVLIAERSPGKRVYLAGADISTDEVEKLLRRHMIRSFVIAGIFILLAIPFTIIFRRSEREKIQQFESLKELLHQQSMDKTTKIERKINDFLNK